MSNLHCPKLEHPYPKGTKVVPIAKNVGCNIKDCHNWNDAKRDGQNFLYVVETITLAGETIYALSNLENNFFCSSNYKPSDLILYNSFRDKDGVILKKKVKKEELNKTKATIIHDEYEFITANSQNNIQIVSHKFQFEIGQKVRIKKNLSKDVEYQMNIYPGQSVPLKQFVNDNMIAFCGKTFKVSGYSMGKYELKNNRYPWTDEMLEPVKEKSIKQEVEIVDAKFGITINISKVIYADPCTIIFYTNESSKKIKKMKATCLYSDEYDKDKGLEIAILKAVSKEIDNQLKKYLID